MAVISTDTSFSHLSSHVLGAGVQFQIDRSFPHHLALKEMAGIEPWPSYFASEVLLPQDHGFFCKACMLMVLIL